MVLGFREEANGDLVPWWIYSASSGKIDMGRKWDGEGEKPVAQQSPIVLLGRMAPRSRGQVLGISKLAVPEWIFVF
jgi:hypothetical protein